MASLPIINRLYICFFNFGSLIIGVEPWENILSIIGISTASLFVPYYRFKYLDKNQNAKISSENIELYKGFILKSLKRESQRTLLRVLDY